jgi:hypothetical protein
MGPIANGILQFLPAWSAIASPFLYLEWRLSSDARRRFAAFILRDSVDGAHVTSIGEFAGLYIENTIFRYFGQKPFSVKALRRSFYLSVISFFSLSCIIYFLYDYTIPARLWEPISIISWKWLSLAVVIILLTDYTSYLVTFHLMKYASSVISFSRVAFLGMIDSFASVYVFILLFPLALVALYVGFFTVPYRVAVIYGLTETPNRQALLTAIDQAAATLGYTNSLQEWSNFVTAKYDNIGKLGGQFIISAEIDPYTAVGSAINGNRNIDPPLFAPMLTLDGVLRYKGLSLQDIKEFLNAHRHEMPDTPYWEGMDTTQVDIPWFTIGHSSGSLAFTTTLSGRLFDYKSHSTRKMGQICAWIHGII